MSAVFTRNQIPTSGAALISRSGNSPVLQSVQADGVVKGLLFELAVEQHYLNSSDINVEAVYTFPLPWGAVLLGMDFVIGEKVLHGTVVAKANAEEKYEAALESGDTAVMLERAADGLYTVNVGNLLAGEKAIVRFRYAQLLSFEQGQVRIAVPTVIAPRYGDPLGASLRNHQVPRHDLLAEYPLQINIALCGEVAEGRLSSPSHALSVRQHSGQIEVGISPSARLDRDFVLLVAGLSGKSICTIGKDGENLVALASFCPEFDSPLPAAPLSMKILVDCSGSMNGGSINSARLALHEVLKNLQPTDRFSYSRFGDDVVHYSQSLMAATPRAVNESSQWVSETKADMGGTQIKEALLSTFALAQPFDADILLITDGEVWDADRLITSAEKAGQRIFAVGIGAAPATSLLHSLASKTGGACEFVGANDDVSSAILRTFHRMRQAPVHDIAVQWGECPSWQSKSGKAIFSGETVHAFAGFTSQPPTSATMEWCEGKDKVQRQLEFLLDTNLIEGDTLARVAAATRRHDADKDLQHSLALQYQLVTETTNLLIVHHRADFEKADDLPELRIAPQMMAAGWGGVGLNAGWPAKQPAVWRRESSSVQVQCMQRNGVETYDIPSFLRKQPDSKSMPVFCRSVNELADPHLYCKQLTSFLMAHVLESGELDETIPYPMTFAELEGKIPTATLDELRMVAELGYLESDVIRAFILTLHGCVYKAGIAKRFFSRIRNFGSSENLLSALEQRVGRVAKEAIEVRIPGLETYDIPAFLRKHAD